MRAPLGEDPFATFTEWAGAEDEEAYAGFEAFWQKWRRGGPRLTVALGYPPSQMVSRSQIPDGLDGPGLDVPVEHDEVGEAALLQHPLAPSANSTQAPSRV